jgi:hypothetical protein
VLNDIEQVLIPDILDKGVDWRIGAMNPIGTPGLHLPDNKMLCVDHVPNIEKKTGIEKCGICIDEI